MLEITTEDVININKVAIYRVANCLNVPTNKRTFTQVFSDISDTGDPLFNLLETFIATYRQYQNFHLILELHDFRVEPRTEFEIETLRQHMLRRDETRQALIYALAVRGC